MDNIIVCRTSEGELIKCESFEAAVKHSLETSGKDVAEIAITAVNNYKSITTRKIGRKGLLLHDVLEDKNATDEEKAKAREELDTLANDLVNDSLNDIKAAVEGTCGCEIDSVEVVYYKGSCDHVYVKPQEYYDNYIKRQAKR